MHDLHNKLEKLESNVKSLIRKLNEAQHANEKLINENTKLKEELLNKEAEAIEAKEVKVRSTDSSPIKEEKYHKIKKDIISCIDEIDACIQMIES